MAEPKSLMWFRSDLRTADNTALAAAGRAGAVVAVYVVTPGQWREHDWAAVKVDFHVRTLARLSRDLAALNIPLLIRRVDRFDGVPTLLLALAREHGCTRLHTNREYEVNEARRDDAVASAFEKVGLAAYLHHDQTVLAPDELSTQAGNFYTVFTPFKRAWIRRLDEHGLGASGPSLRPAPVKQSPTGIEPDPVPERIAGFESTVDRALWPAGEGAAADRLGAFIGRGIDRYDDERDRAAADGTSTLSPYLACGSISARQCLTAAARSRSSS